MNLYFPEKKKYIPVRDKKDWSKLYPNINHKEGEDLNIDNMKIKHLNLHWFDLKEYPTIKSIADSLLYSERRIFQLAKKLKLPSRKKV